MKLKIIEEKTVFKGSKRKDGSVVPLMNSENNFTHIGSRKDFPDFYEEDFSGYVIEKIPVMNLEILIDFEEQKEKLSKVSNQINTLFMFI